jgi:hypothetical protein
MDDFPTCDNCGGPIVPDDIGPVWIVTVRKEHLPNLRDENGNCVSCRRPLWGARDEENEDDESSPDPRQCRRCKGSGVDPEYHRRFTSGGHDERPCRECGGTGERSDGHSAGAP